MRFLLYIFFIARFFFSFFSHESWSEESFSKLNDTLYVSKFEASNKLYADFLNSDEYRNNPKVKIDTSQWLKKGTYSMPFVSYYHKHPAFKNYPVVNISYEAAQLFCQWFTKQYNNDPKGKFKKVIFRLPTEQEWELAAKGGNANSKYGWKGDTITDSQGKELGNFLSKNDTSNTSSDITENIKSFQPNAYGIYNMSGNVSEMVQDRKFVKGGDWDHDSEYCKIKARLSWNGTPKPYIGFRLVMIVKEQ